MSSFFQVSLHPTFRVVMAVKPSIDFFFLDWPPPNPSASSCPLIKTNLVAAYSTVLYLLSLDLLSLSPGQRDFFSMALALLAFAPQSSDTQFSHSEALSQVSSTVSSLDNATTSSANIFSYFDALRESKIKNEQVLLC